ncbi:2-hydroxy-3-oxopropionate reductase [Sporolactobacillus kofuensis]|uniref:2-hydroxy-3-oxopropionate reductase n=1 Tax=Sporolactobacillus kofuensis TaxID=269672 RepID=A0ABW1WFB6_9BACL|nr:2-hydroxy-3-oxopropionate reductase [Sporolactobacillus kofuensis]MCO7174887.1 2-hydroxy-3-oxopropionate reductase [Sporolactobacillus kofuensis]
MEKTIGFIGLGIMGKPMARNLIRANYSLMVHDLNRSAVDELVQLGASAASSAKEVAENCKVIITMLPKGQHVKMVALGSNGIIEGAQPGTIVIDMSSITPAESIDIAKGLAEHKIEMLDAPVSGGEPKAIDGTLAIMVGGNQTVFESVRNVLDAMGASVTLVGGTGCGSTAKLANQIIVNLNIAAMSEALVLAAKAGINIEKMYEAIRGGLAGSTVLDAKVPMILERNFNPGGKIAINMKDITNVIATSHDLDVPLPLTSQLLEIFHALKADGKVNLDHSGIIQFYEKVANVTVNRTNEKLVAKKG